MLDHPLSVDTLMDAVGSCLKLTKMLDVAVFVHHSLLVDSDSFLCRPEAHVALAAELFRLTVSLLHWAPPLYEPINIIQCRYVKNSNSGLGTPTQDALQR